jgi:hypothetical protein
MTSPFSSNLYLPRSRNPEAISNVTDSSDSHADKAPSLIF